MERLKRLKDNFLKLKDYQRDLLVIGIIFLISLFYFWQPLWNYLKAEMVNGGDGVSHYGIAKYYSDNIFPRPYGWIPVYYAGMPFPLLYPPLFYFLIALFVHLFSLSVLLIFKLFIVFLILTFPWLVFWFAKKLGLNQIGSFLSGLLTIHFLGLPAKYGGWLGGPIEATFGVGLVTQLFGFWLMFLWLCFFIKLNENKKYFYLSIFLLAAILLTNAHVVILTLLIFLVFTIVKTLNSSKKLEILKNYLLTLVLSFGLASFWYFPFFSYYRYSLAITFPQVDFVTPIIILVAILAGLLAIKKRNFEVISIIIICLSFFILKLPLKEVFPSLPLQPFRIIIVLYLFLLILASYIVSELIERFQLKPLATLVFCLLFLALFFSQTRIYNPYRGVYPLSEKKVDQVVEFMKSFQDGRSMVEVRETQDPRSPISGETLPDHFVIAALLGAIGQPTIWNVFRESSLNSPFAQPLRNSFSKWHESWGIVCTLCEGNPDWKFNMDNPKDLVEQFYSQPISTDIKRAKLFNLKYFILSNEETINTFASLPNLFEKIGQFGEWSIFKLKGDSSYAWVLDSQPVLVFTQLKTKDRPYDGLGAYDWLRLNEEWFFQADFDNFFALAENSFLDEKEDLERFKIALIIDYKYKNLEVAFQNLKDYAKNNKLILFSSSNPLFLKLKENSEPNVIIFNPTGEVREDVKKITEIIEKIKVPTIGEGEIPKINEIKFDREEITLKVNNPAKKTIPVYLSSSYFPLWRDLKGGEVYLASPASTLILTNQEEIKMKFSFSIYDKIGWSVSLLTLFFLIWLILYSKIKKRIS